MAAKAPSLAACKPVEHGGNSTLYAGDGSKLGVIASDEAAAPVSIARIPKSSSWRRWRSRTSASTSTAAIDPEGDPPRGRARTSKRAKAVEGGSTITQQLVRNLCISHPARNLERKIIEAKLAIEYCRATTRSEKSSAST